jgi:purine-binding chemotaxis protein CheW
MDPLSATQSSGVVKLLTMHLGEQEFCVDIMKVREIRGWSPTTFLPQSPPYVLGVVNLRGTVIPVIDLAVRLGLSRPEPSARDAIVVTQIRDQLVGLLVQGVTDMIELDSNQVQATPEAASDGGLAYVEGLLALEKRLVAVLSLDQVLPTPIPLAAQH